MVQLDNGKKNSIETDEYCTDDGYLYMTQAYVMTVYSSQGLTIDGDVFVYYNTGMDRSNTYVASSRHKDNCHWFVDKKEIDLQIFSSINPISHSSWLAKLLVVWGKKNDLN